MKCKPAFPFVSNFLCVRRDLCGKPLLLRDLPLNVFELNGNPLGHAGFLHGNPIKYVGDTHGGFVVSNNKELCILGKFFQNMGKSINVAFVQGGIHLVQDTERTGLDWNTAKAVTRWSLPFHHPRGA